MWLFLSYIMIVWCDYCQIVVILNIFIASTIAAIPLHLSAAIISSSDERVHIGY